MCGATVGVELQCGWVNTEDGVTICMGLQYGAVAGLCFLPVQNREVRQLHPSTSLDSHLGEVTAHLTLPTWVKVLIGGSVVNLATVSANSSTVQPTWQQFWQLAVLFVCFF